MLTEARSSTRAVFAAAALAILLVVFLVGRATVRVGGPPAVPGPYRSADGITLGFAHTEVGAEAAAAHDLLELERAMDTLSIQRTDAVSELVATNNEARALAAHAASVIALEQAHGAPLRRVAISTQTDSYSTSAAEVTVLESWIYAAPSQEALWAIERVSLVWGGTDWRVSAITGAAPSSNESLADLRAQLKFPGPGDASVR